MGFLAPAAAGVGLGLLASKGGLTGQTKDLTPPDVTRYRQGLLSFLQGQGFETGLTGADVPIDLEPYQRLFAQRRAEGLAQAKESAGTLTGSGFANILGAAAGRSIYDENAFLAQLMENARLQSARNYIGLAGLSPGLTGQTGYQPGFLDYLFSGAQAAAPVIASVVGGPAIAAGAAAGAASAGRGQPQRSNVYGPAYG